MDLRSYYLSRFLFLIIWSIITDMKCQSNNRINAMVSVSVTHLSRLGELFQLKFLQTTQLSDYTVLPIYPVAPIY